MSPPAFGHSRPLRGGPHIFPPPPLQMPSNQQQALLAIPPPPAHREQSHPEKGQPFNPGFLAPAALVALMERVEQESFCPPGFTFSVYDAGLKRHYNNIPSHRVTANSGSLKYATFYEKYGLSTKFRFQLCAKFVEGQCSDGKHCANIHALVDSSSVGKSIHVNENLADCNTIQDVINSQQRPLANAHGYRTLTDGVLVAVQAPNAQNEPSQLIYSGNLLYTLGGIQAYNATVGQLNHQSSAQTVRPRHCAHFQFRKVCNMGEECNFVHSLAPYVQPRFRRPNDAPLLPPPASITVTEASPPVPLQGQQQQQAPPLVLANGTTQMPAQQVQQQQQQQASFCAMQQQVQQQMQPQQMQLPTNAVQQKAFHCVLHHHQQVNPQQGPPPSYPTTTAGTAAESPTRLSHWNPEAMPSFAFFLSE